VPSASRRSGGFSLIDVPSVIPDDDEEDVAPSPRTEPARAPAPAEATGAAATPSLSAAPAPLEEPALEPAATAERPARPQRRSGARLTPPADAPASPRAPTTVRLNQAAADAIRQEFLSERRTGDPTLSSTVFYSKVVMAGLEALRRQPQRS
jgi:hypothetical protein